MNKFNKIWKRSWDEFYFSVIAALTLLILAPSNNLELAFFFIVIVFTIQAVSDALDHFRPIGTVCSLLKLDSLMILGLWLEPISKLPLANLTRAAMLFGYITIISALFALLEFRLEGK